eukprot:5128059-Pyramimonas_sp.AAC.1
MPWELFERSGGGNKSLNITSFYGSSCANNGKGALNTPPREPCEDGAFPGKSGHPSHDLRNAPLRADDVRDALLHGGRPQWSKAEASAARLQRGDDLAHVVADHAEPRVARVLLNHCEPPGSRPSYGGQCGRVDSKGVIPRPRLGQKQLQIILGRVVCDQRLGVPRYA